MRRVLDLWVPTACYRDLCRVCSMSLSQTTWSPLERCFDSSLIGRWCSGGGSRVNGESAWVLLCSRSAVANDGNVKPAPNFRLTAKLCGTCETSAGRSFPPHFVIHSSSQLHRKFRLLASTQAVVY